MATIDNHIYHLIRKTGEPVARHVVRVIGDRLLDPRPIHRDGYVDRGATAYSLGAAAWHNLPEGAAARFNKMCGEWGVTDAVRSILRDIYGPPPKEHLGTVALRVRLPEDVAACYTPELAAKVLSAIHSKGLLHKFDGHTPLT